MKKPNEWVFLTVVVAPFSVLFFVMGTSTWRSSWGGFAYLVILAMTVYALVRNRL